ncbi:STAS domain-containing protein [Ruminococcus sp.]|uniref:STAS domain-containing protein n=1 Tax=Ruminococcus sp. TaxID=41978 RepID=UPI002E772677|nr:STAS domain-containing protein [Ruminococcus sp.]MEE1261780.1 STAS domain-containing protein [Ruminococcus sp.]
MNIKRKKEGSNLSVTVNGRIDTATAPAFEAEVKPYLDGVTNLTIDFKDVNYVSSAGLRVLLSLQKKMMVQGEMKLINVSEAVNDVFEVTGFDEILTYEMSE